ncbi:MAG: TldD/PmbA family protein [Candidatus Poribacteria bacterium]
MIAEKLIEKAMKKAQGAQAIITKNEHTTVSFESDRLKSVESSQRTDIRLRVVLDGKIGLSNTTDINDLDGVVARAIECAEFGSPAHFQFPSPQDGIDVKIYDQKIVPLSKIEMVKINEEMMDLVKQYNPNIIVYASADKDVLRREFANSSGVSFVDEETYFSTGIFGVLVRGNDILEAGHGFGCKKRDIDHISIASKVVKLFKMAENTTTIKSGNIPVIFTPSGIEVLLLALELGFNGKNVFLGSSPLAGKLGEKIADERFSLIDNPLIDYASGSRKYDDEGVPHQITPLIDKGIVENFLYDLDTAGRSGTKTNGHGIGCNPTNLIIKEGETSFEDMVKNTKEGLIVESVMGLGQGNPISGEFSVNVHLGYKIENGEIVGRVKDVMLSGNTYDALKNISAIGDKSEWVYGSLYAPYIQIGSLSVIAK